MNDEIRFEILEDGTISTETDGISGANHQSADELLESLVNMLGGGVKIKKRKGHVHSHKQSKNVHSH